MISTITNSISNNFSLPLYPLPLLSKAGSVGKNIFNQSPTKEVPFGCTLKWRLAKNLPLRIYEENKELKRTAELLQQCKGIESIENPDYLHLANVDFPEKYTIKLLYRNGMNNYKLAKSIMQDTLNDVCCSSNTIAVNEKTTQKKLANIMHEFFLQNMHRKSFYKEIRGNDSLDFKYHQIVAETTRTISLGNEYEMCALALIKAMEKGIWDIHVDIIRIGKRYFVLVGRNPMQGASKILNVGESLSPLFSVVDFLKKEVITLSQLKENFKDHLNDFQLVMSNMLSKQEIMDEVGITPELMQSFMEGKEKIQKHFFAFGKLNIEIDRFHTSENLQEKIAAAEKAKLICLDPVFKQFPKISELAAQFQYFIELSHQWKVE